MQFENAELSLEKLGVIQCHIAILSNFYGFTDFGRPEHFGREGVTRTSGNQITAGFLVIQSLSHHPVLSLTILMVTPSGALAVCMRGMYTYAINDACREVRRAPAHISYIRTPARPRHAPRARAAGPPAPRRRRGGRSRGGGQPPVIHCFHVFVFARPPACPDCPGRPQTERSIPLRPVHPGSAA